MPRARRKDPGPEPVAEEVEEMEVEQDEPHALQSNEPLTWKLGKQIAVADLLRRLKTLSAELASIEQEDGDRETLVPKAREVVSPQLLGHKDKGVKAYALLCVAEMFRLLAPDAPFTPAQMKDIFTLFTSTIVPALANPSDPYNQQHTAILSSLTTVKSIVLLTDIPGSDKVALNLFANCFDVMSGGSRLGVGEKLPKNLEYHMTNMLCSLVDEFASLPSGVIDIILAQFLRADPNAMTSGGKKGEMRSAQTLPELPPAYNMARSVCNTCAEKISRAIGLYFSSVLIDASENFATAKPGKSRGKKRTHDESEDDSDDGLLTPPAEEDLREVEKAHRLLRELWRSAPDVIQGVVPQIEQELEAESVPLRVIAVQTIGDMIAGIGAAGPPSLNHLDPAAYPSQSLDDNVPPAQPQSILLTPNAPHAFSSVYSHAYQLFAERYRDKAALVRSAWVSGAGRVILTSGGGKGLDAEQEKSILDHLSSKLMDSDDRVRLTAVQTVASFDFASIVQKLGKSGSVLAPNSILCNLADRIKDKKTLIRAAAMEVLGRIWGVAAGAIAEGSQRIRDLLGAIPSKIFEAWYVNDREIFALIQQVLYDSLLPITFPPIKAKQTGDSQRVADSQSGLDNTPDPDAIRAERILVLVRDLEDKAKIVFFKLQQRQEGLAKYMEAYLQACESFNDNEKKNEKEAKKKLDVMIKGLLEGASTSTDIAIATEHLKKFAEHHDRRAYQLIRFCYNPESDYRKIFKATKELSKRMEDAPTGVPAVLDTLLPIVRCASILVYNRSHVPAIVEISRTDDKGLGNAAHEVLKEISTHAPQIFRVHVHELCETLKNQMPTAHSSPDLGTIDTLKACAGFARRFPDGMPKDRDFYKAMVAYAIHGKPPKAAKHAVTVIVTAADKKEMYIKEIQKACIKSFDYGADGFLSKLASISQLRLLANRECEDHAEAITDIAISQTLGQIRTAASRTDPEWTDEIDDDLAAKLWALRILVNGLRGFPPNEGSENPEADLKDVAVHVYKLLNTLVKKDGELSASESTPAHHKAHLRLAAAIHLLKLSCERKFDAFLTPQDFNMLSTIAQDQLPGVRAGFVKALKKYLGSGRLPNRFYGLIFLYAFEPDKDSKELTTTWLKSRAAMSAKIKDNAMEAAFPRFLSLLAHHQDFSNEIDDLVDFVAYIVFYLKNVATEANLPMIYYLAQRLKAVQDGIDGDKSENLYILSDIAQAVVRLYQDIQGWSLPAVSGKIGLPSGLFAKLPSHAVAQEIADKNYIPDELAEQLEDIVKDSMKTKKRKADHSSGQASKKPKPSTSNATAPKKAPARKAPKVAKTPKKKAEDDIPSSERRKSGRASNARNYAENDDSEDDDELEQWQMGDDDEANKENVQESSTPPTSDPTPAPAKTIVEEIPPRSKTKAVAATKQVTPKKAKSQQPTKKVPARATRARKEKDVMDVPSDSDVEMNA